MINSDIFVPTSNRIDALSACLSSLELQSDKSFRVLLIGIRPLEQIDELIKKFSFEIIYKIQVNPGIIGAANEALKLAKHNIFIRIDDDVVLSEDWHKEIIRTFDSNPIVGGVTGPTLMSELGLRSRDLTLYLTDFESKKNFFTKILKFIFFNIIYDRRIKCNSTFLESGAFTLGSNFPSSLIGDEPYEVSNLEACNWSARRDLLINIGGFDKTLTKGLGDFHEADAALKILKNGNKLYFNPKAIVNHCVEVGKVSAVRPESFYRIQNFIIFYFRHREIIRSRGKCSFGVFSFMLNLFMQNIYYCYKGIKHFRPKEFLVILGTIVGFLRVVKNEK